MTFLASLVAAAAISIPNPILFVTQVPIPGDFTTVASTFGNHDGQIDSAPRGGDLWIVYPDGIVKNLTRTAGFGNDGMQSDKALAVGERSGPWGGPKGACSVG